MVSERFGKRSEKIKLVDEEEKERNG